MTEVKKDSLFVKFIKQFNDFMIIILIVAAIISAAISFFDGSNDYIDSIIIIAIVSLNALMGLIQEARAEKALDALKKLSSPMAKVKRNGKVQIIKTSELVPGDYIIIENGNYVPADARLIKAYNLKVEEASLTGETLPVLKNATSVLNKKIALADMTNMIFSTTIICSRACRSNCHIYRNEYKSRKNSKYDNRK